MSAAISSEPASSGPLRLPAALLRPLAAIYGAAVGARNRRFDRGRGVVRIAAPVVSVGNLTAGGTGKTPMVAEIVSRLTDLGARPVVAMRGYGARVDGRSDERLVLESLLPTLRVVSGADRVASLARAGEPREPGTVVVLDDGFQHRRIARDLDLVLVDATRPSLEDPLLPAGWLREPAVSLRRADAVVVTRSRGRDERLAAAIERLHGRPPIAWTDHAWSGLDRFEGGNLAGAEPVEWLEGRRVAVVAGVARPEAFEEMVRAAGAVVVACMAVRDHQRYSRGRVAALARQAAGVEAVVTTLKDWVKLRRWWPPDRTIVVPRLGIRWHEGEELLSQRLREAAFGAAGAGGASSRR